LPQVPEFECKLYEYRRSAPHGRLSVPTTEHFDPLFVAMGAAWPDDDLETIYAGFHHGNPVDAQFQPGVIFRRDSWV
jgi:aromatic ring-opening dioxygenase catalytic subunit (LigB family)